MRIRITASELREKVRDEIADSIAIYRESRSEAEEDFEIPDGPPTEQEITDFICTNQLLDFDTVSFLTEYPLLGFDARIDSVRAEWLSDFLGKVREWAETNTWFGADLIDISKIIVPQPNESLIWSPPQSIRPSWIENSPTALMLAADLLNKGKLLSELHWRDFEKLIASLLEEAGWDVELTQGSKDGGIDVIAQMNDPIIGEIKALWQAKKYHPNNKVKLSQVRELSAIRDDKKATKAIIVTTSQLTSGAIEWIRRDEYRLDYKEKDDIEKWVLDSIS